MHTCHSFFHVPYHRGRYLREGLHWVFPVSHMDDFALGTEIYLRGCLVEQNMG